MDNGCGPAGLDGLYSGPAGFTPLVGSHSWFNFPRAFQKLNENLCPFVVTVTKDSYFVKLAGSPYNGIMFYYIKVDRRF